MATFEYKTTSGSLTDINEDRLESLEDPDPVSPKGDGWELVSSAVHRDRVLWFWRRRCDQSSAP